MYLLIVLKTLKMMTNYRSLVDSSVSSGGIDGLTRMFKLCFGRPGDDVEAELRLKRCRR